jgi:SAM-dependent methyltransferase
MGTSTWWSNFFNGLSADVVSRISNPKQTVLEADFLQKELQLHPNAVIADIPCGDGRLLLELSKRGFQVRGIDISKELVQKAKSSVSELGIVADIEVGDMKMLRWFDEIDGCFCFGNSFSYFDEQGNHEFLKSVHRALRTGGRFVLQTNVIAESILTRPLARSWYELGDILFLHVARYESETASLSSDYQFIRGQTVEKKTAIYRIYSVREVVQLLKTVGFQNPKIFGDLEGNPFKLGDPSLYIVVQK